MNYNPTLAFTALFCSSLHHLNQSDCFCLSRNHLLLEFLLYHPDLDREHLAEIFSNKVCEIPLHNRSIEFRISGVLTIEELVQSKRIHVEFLSPKFTESLVLLLINNKEAFFFLMDNLLKTKKEKIDANLFLDYSIKHYVQDPVNLIKLFDEAYNRFKLQLTVKTDSEEMNIEDTIPHVHFLGRIFLKVLRLLDIPEEVTPRPADNKLLPLLMACRSYATGRKTEQQVVAIINSDNDLAREFGDFCKKQDKSHRP